jgi:hypothetical protein
VKRQRERLDENELKREEDDERNIQKSRKEKSRKENGSSLL